MLVSGFCFLFISGFCELADSATESEWVASCVLSILVDMVLFEVVPVFVVSILGVMLYVCRMKCLFCLFYLVEGYRSIRSFVGT